jgi:hypothetical protein
MGGADWSRFPFAFVMAGLVPAIHVLFLVKLQEDVDTRHKAGHDGN